MASKKCPKCGEDNPAEAVMCWACYTPLSGSAPLGAGLAASTAAGAMPKTAAGGPIGVPQTEAPAKKGVDAKTIGVGAVALLGVIAAIMMSGVMGGGGNSDPVALGEDPPAMVDPGVSGPATGGVAPPPLSAPPTGGGGAAVAPVPINFKTVASPGGSYKTGTLGILVTSNTASPAGVAKFAKDQFARNGRWTNMQVAVFTDQATADSFADFQRKRDNQPLTNADFKSLADSGVWNTTPAFLDSRGRQDRIYYPSKNPTSWWPGR